jgi:S-adenosylmethionine synthetase
MILRDGLFTSESVSDGHPDKICDQISDAILDACLAQDDSSRVAVETAIKGNLICIIGEVTTKADIDLRLVAHHVLVNIGHEAMDTGHEGRWGLNPNHLTLVEKLSIQSPNIATGVDRPDGAIGAGDQGLMFGYACRETDTYAPIAISLAHGLMRRQREVRRAPEGAILGPDAKSQVTIRYRDGKPVAVDTVLVSTQHIRDIPPRTIHDLVRDRIVRHVIPEHLLTKETRVLINPTGVFEIGGPVADAGVTGRKIIVDSYGGAARHGGGAFSGKDPTKVDRSAAYAARQLALSLVARGWAEHAEVQVAYAIGVAEPVSISVNTFGSGQVPDRDLIETACPNIRKLLTPGSIIERLNLRRPLYLQTATFGHFGRADLDLPWEKPLAEVRSA